MLNAFVRQQMELRRTPLGLWAKRTTQHVLNYGCMTLLAVFFLFPIVFMIVSSFKPEKAIFDDLKTVTRAFAPTQITGENYEYIFNRVPFPRYMFNSVAVVTLTVTAGLIVNSLIAFALARLQWRGKSIVLSIVIALIIVPLETVAVPLLVLANELPWFGGMTTWLNTLHVQIVPFVADAFSIFLFYQFFIGLPKDFDEAAYIDGASPFEIYRRIIMPLSRPVIATVAILHSLGMWSSYLWPLMVTRTEEVRPLTVGITTLYTYEIKWGHILAFASLITIPVLILFLMFQKWFVKSVASTGIKG